MRLIGADCKKLLYVHEILPQIPKDARKHQLHALDLEELSGCVEGSLYAWG